MNNGFSMNNGIVNWPEIKTRRVRLNGPAASNQTDANQGRGRQVLNVVATNLERLKETVVQTIQRL
jgi:hypothetical protein